MWSKITPEHSAAPYSLRSSVYLPVVEFELRSWLLGYIVGGWEVGGLEVGCGGGVGSSGGGEGGGGGGGRTAANLPGER